MSQSQAYRWHDVREWVGVARWPDRYPTVEAELVAGLDPCAYVVDCLPNMPAPLVEERAVPLVRTLRRARPATPIVLVEDRTYPSAAFRPAVRESNQTRRAALGAALRQLREDGVPNLSYVAGDALLAGDGEATVDGSHPTDLGFTQYAAALQPIIRAALLQQPAP